MDTALILAGGQSIRFGTPKALVDVAGKPMVARVADAVASLVGEIVVSVAEARDADFLRPILPRAKFAVDRRRSVGPIEGMTRGFQVARGERVLVAPCDAPLLRPDLYRLLIKSLGAHDAAVPQVGVFDPIRAVYRRREVRRRLAAPTVSLPSPSSLVDRVDALHELDEEPLVVEQLAGEGLQEWPERIFVLVDRCEEFGTLRLEVRFQLLDIVRAEREVLHVGLRVLLRLAGEAIGERRLGVRHLVRRAHPEDDGQTLSRQRAQARERGHRGSLLADTFRLVNGGIAAVQ